MSAKWKSIETKYMEAREEALRALAKLDRRDFLRVSSAVLGATLAKGIVSPHSFSMIDVAQAQDDKAPAGAQGKEPFRVAYISDSHLYEKKLNDRFVNALMRAVDDVNALDPQPDFVLYGGDLAQLGQPRELDLGAEILKQLKAPVRMMVGEHDWYLDMGEKWRDLFGAPTYSFDHKGVHFVVLNSVVEKDFWTERKLSPMDRMKTVAGLDNSVQSPFSVGDEQRSWLSSDLGKLSPTTPVVVFSHSPLYKLYKPWNFWTDDAEQVQAILNRFKNVTVVHGHTHQLLTNRIGNIHFHGMLSTAWPWPYAPQGLPALTIQMSRPDPFNPNDGCGDGTLTVHPDALIDKFYNLWNRNPINIPRNYLASKGQKDRPKTPPLSSY
ncbi:MAG TPA: metallophosphoesterase [Polyangiales bacterium]|nr:metallophosphoesterase [Polyangiales bacterium]